MSDPASGAAAPNRQASAATRPQRDRRGVTPGAISGRRVGRQRSAARPATDTDPIAIIGLSGRYPEAVNIDAYWRNLRDGKDCIIEVPKERWDWREYFSEDRRQSGRHYSKWGGFIAGVDEFDPLFFNISPKEAEYDRPAGAAVLAACVDGDRGCGIHTREPAEPATCERRSAGPGRRVCRRDVQ